MKYRLPKKIVSAMEATPANMYEVDHTAHPSTSFPIPTTNFKKDFLDLAEQLKAKVGLASAPKRVERPQNKTKLDGNGKLVGDIDTHEEAEGEVERIDLTKKATSVYEGVKRPNFRAARARRLTTEPEGPVKDERESEDKQPKEAVACESDWHKLTRLERDLLNSRDRAGIREKIPSKIRQRFLLSKLDDSARAAEESSATEGDDQEVKYYLYKFYQDGSLLNTAYSELYPASGDYAKSEGPCALVFKGLSDGKWKILESKDLESSHSADITEAIEVLNQDGNELMADEGIKGKPVFTSSSTDAGVKLDGVDYGRVRVSKEELGLDPDSPDKQQDTLPKDRYAIKIAHKNSLYRDINGEVGLFNTETDADIFAQTELGLLPEDYETVKESEISAMESVSTTWYALVATESDRRTIQKVTVKADRPATRKAAREYLETTYGKNSVYLVADEPINF